MLVGISAGVHSHVKAWRALLAYTHHSFWENKTPLHIHISINFLFEYTMVLPGGYAFHTFSQNVTSFHKFSQHENRYKIVKAGEKW